MSEELPEQPVSSENQQETEQNIKEKLKKLIESQSDCV